jgi:RNA polymerase sigma factor (TIGR02999 family)
VADDSAADVSSLLARVRGGSSEAFDELFPLVYAELRRMASREMRREHRGRTLQTTALVHEAYLRLLKDASLSFENRAHFLGIAARAMREVLIDRSRARDAKKRGGQEIRVTLDEARLPAPDAGVPVDDLDRALARLTDVSPRAARVVEMRFFGGLSVEETAAAMDISPATVKREWALARAWLHRDLTGSGATPS